MGRSTMRCLLTAVLLAGAAAPVCASVKTFPANIDLVSGVVRQVVDQALADMRMPDDGGNVTLLVVARTRHSGNWLVEHQLASGLLDRGVKVRLDSARSGQTSCRLGYRVLDLRVTGEGRLVSSSIRRQAYAAVTFRLSKGDVVLWQEEYSATAADRVPKQRADLLENPRYSFADTDLNTQSWGQFIEPAVVSTVLGGLVYLFFSNR